MNVGTGSGLPISLDVSETLVAISAETEHEEEVLSMAPEEETQPGAATRVPESPSFWERATGRAWSTGGGGGVTVRQPREPIRQRAEVHEALPSTATASTITLQALRDEITSRQLQAEVAELAVREALARRMTAEHLLAAQDLEETLSQRSRPQSPSDSPSERPPLPTPVLPSGTSEMSRLIQSFDEQRREDRRAAEEQRREDRREAEEREERYHRAAEEREARREAYYEAQLAALATKTSADKHHGGYTPSKGFTDIEPFSGERGQDLLTWLQLLRSRANLLHTPEEDVARELCLKLQGAALQSYNQGFAADASPTFAEVAAHLSKSFIKPYQGAVRWSGFFLFKRVTGSSGKEVKQQLHNARQRCLDDGIPVDDLSSAEHLYYIYQLSLLPAQSAQFLATLSSNPLVSDDYLRTLTPMGEADRRASVAGPKSSAARTALFQARVALIEAYLDHDNGDGGRGGGVRVAVTTGSPDGPTEPAAISGAPGPNASGALAPPGAQPFETECQLRFAHADRGSANLSSPEYFGANDKHKVANKAEHVKRRNFGCCYACLMSKVKYDQSFLGCSQHGLSATPTQRADPAWRVKGSAMPGRAF